MLDISRVLKVKEPIQHEQHRTCRLVLQVWFRMMADGTFPDIELDDTARFSGL